MRIHNLFNKNNANKPPLRIYLVFLSHSHLCGWQFRDSRRRSGAGWSENRLGRLFGTWRPDIRLTKISEGSRKEYLWGRVGPTSWICLQDIFFRERERERDRGGNPPNSIHVPRYSESRQSPWPIFFKTYKRVILNNSAERTT